MTRLSNTFFGASVFNGDVRSWDTGRCTDMSGLFGGAVTLAQDVSGWNTGAVVDMADLFAVAVSFNSDVSAWNVSNVVDMSRMFRDAESFNVNLSAWDVRRVTAMDGMFQVRCLCIIVIDDDDTGMISLSYIGWFVFFTERPVVFPEFVCLGLAIVDERDFFERHFSRRPPV